jgi:biotin operon repressor
MKQSNRTKPQKINLKPTHPIATFQTQRKRMDVLRKFETCIADLFPPGVNLTGNEFKVLYLLRAACVGRSNVAAIDQEKISEVCGVSRPNVARAITGLRQKGMLLKTWMEAGPKAFRNIYALWVPPEILEQDAAWMLEQRDQARALEQQADEEDRKAQEAATKAATPYLHRADAARKQAQAVRETTCPICKGEGEVLVYLPSEKRERWRWCTCSAGRRLAQEVGCKGGDFHPETISNPEP